MPSGLDPDTGEIRGDYLAADVTVSFGTTRGVGDQVVLRAADPINATRHTSVAELGSYRGVPTEAGASARGQRPGSVASAAATERACR